jgi:hypothetical protein
VEIAISVHITGKIMNQIISPNPCFVFNPNGSFPADWIRHEPPSTEAVFNPGIALNSEERRIVHET